MVKGEQRRKQQWPIWSQSPSYPLLWPSKINIKIRYEEKKILKNRAEDCRTVEPAETACTAHFARTAHSETVETVEAVETELTVETV